MDKLSDLDQFLRDIMNIQVFRMGGAAAAIMGSAGSDTELVGSLKRHSIKFARAYRSPETDREGLTQAADEIEGLIRTLQLTSTLSQSAAEKLMGQLDQLMDKSVS